MENSLHRVILETHSISPLFRINLVDFTHFGTWTSEKTGNTSKVKLLIKGSKVSDLGFSCQGSALSQACSSIMCSQIKEMNFSDIHLLANEIINFVESGTICKLPGDLIVYETISRFPERLDCSLLSWRALVIALSEN